MGTEIDSLEIEIHSSASTASSALDDLSQSLQKLSGSIDPNTMVQLKTLTSRIKSLSGVLQSMQAEKMTAIGNAAATLSASVNGTTNEALSVFVSRIRSLGKVLEKIDFSNVGVLSTSIAQMGQVINKLPVDNLDKIIELLKNMKGNIASAVKQFSKMAAESQKSSTGVLGAVKGLVTKFGKLAAAIQLVRRSYSYLAEAFRNAIDYEETQNLYATAMRQIGLRAGEEFEMAFLEKADEFQEHFSSALGLDIDSTKNAQAIFGSLTSSMGLTEEASYAMSESLTLLAADMSSLWNENYSDVAASLQSAMAGQARSMRDYGVDITQASLAEVALAYGIDKRVTAMTQGEKAQLRYIKIMQTLTAAQGDMARTMDSPANMLRILNEQVHLLSRSIGNVLIPILKIILPVAIAIVKVLQMVFNAIAGLFGYKPPSYTETPISIVAEGEDEEIDSATGSLKKLKSVALGFDELNVIEPNQGGIGGASFGANTFDLTPEIMRLNEEYTAMVNNILANMDNLSTRIAEGFTAGFHAAVEAVKTFIGYFEPSFEVLKSTVQEMAPLLLESLLSIGDTLVSFWQNQLSPILGYITSEFIPGLVNPFVSTVVPILSDVLLGAIKTVGTAFSGMAEVIDTVWNSLLLPIFEQVKEIGVNVFATISDAWNEYGESILGGVQDFVAGLFELFQSIWTKVFYPVIEPLLEALKKIWDSSLSNILEKVFNFVLLLIDAGIQIWNEFIQPIVDWLGGILGPAFEWVSSVMSGAITYAVEGIRVSIEFLTALFTGLIEFIRFAFTGDWREAWENIGDFFRKVWINIANFFIELWNKIIGGLESAVNYVIGGLNNLIDGVNKVSKVLGFTLSHISTVTLARVPLIGYAQGGIPSYGELFIARENGIPEMVGQFGNRTGVANNDQIVEAVSQGVYQAVSSAFTQRQESSNSFHIYLDGKQITASVEKVQRERGLDIMPMRL